MPDKEAIRTFILAGFCLILPIYNWHYIVAPSHRAMTLLVLSTVASGALFYELTMRDAPMEWVLAGVSGVMGVAALTWIGLWLFSTTLANDHAALMASHDNSGRTSCSGPPGALHILLGGTRAIGQGNGPFTPFRVGTCSGPTVTRTPQGLLINAFGYDDDGTLIYRIRDNQFKPSLDADLHFHRRDRSTLALYDKMENEVFYLRYLNPDAVRIRGFFRCGETTTVAVRNDETTIGESKLTQPRCFTMKPGPAAAITFQPH